MKGISGLGGKINISKITNAVKLKSSDSQLSNMLDEAKSLFSANTGDLSKNIDAVSSSVPNIIDSISKMTKNVNSTIPDITSSAEENPSMVDGNMRGIKNTASGFTKEVKSYVEESTNT